MGTENKSREAERIREERRGNRDAELIKMCEVEGYIESFSMTCIRFSRGIGFVKPKAYTELNINTPAKELHVHSCPVSYEQTALDPALRLCTRPLPRGTGGRGRRQARAERTERECFSLKPLSSNKKKNY